MRSLRMLGFAVLTIMTGSVMLAAAPAKASTMDYNFSFTGALGDNITGSFAANGVNIDPLSFVGLASGPNANGSINGLITSPDPFYASPSQGWTFSNTTDGNAFTGDGVLFQIGAGNYGNIYDSAGITYLSLFTPDTLWNPGEIGRLDISATPIPEPAGLFASGLALLIGVTYLRKKKQGAGMSATPA